MTDTDTLRPPIRQTSKHSCPACGSFYRRGDRCNICNKWAPVPRENLDSRSFINRTKLPPKGRIWDKKLHRYIN